MHGEHARRSPPAPARRCTASPTHHRATPRRVRPGALRLRPRRVSGLSRGCGGVRRHRHGGARTIRRRGDVKGPSIRARPPGSDARSRSRRPRRISRRTAWLWRWRAAARGGWLRRVDAWRRNSAGDVAAGSSRGGGGEGEPVHRSAVPRKLGEAYEGEETPDAAASGRIGRTGATRARGGCARGFIRRGVGGHHVRSVRAGRGRHPRGTQLGRRFDSRAPASPAVSRVTINVHKVRGVVAKAALDGGRGRRARRGRRRRAGRPPVSTQDRRSGGHHRAGVARAQGTGDVGSVHATVHRDGTPRGRDDGGPPAPGDVCVGRVDVDISSLPMRPAKGRSRARTG